MRRRKRFGDHNVFDFFEGREIGTNPPQKISDWPGSEERRLLKSIGERHEEILSHNLHGNECHFEFPYSF